MKTLGVMLLSAFVLGSSVSANAQQYEASVPGDNFSLEGALELFKKSTSPEDFERLLNNPDGKVNNLDLNGDGEVDYIRVIDRNDGNVHIFILQAVVSDSESQDIATIELEKLENGKAVLQITGDEDIYGIETIIEPTEEVRINAGTTTTQTVVNVWAWPSVQYVYSPSYVVWVSPWHWHIRPVWWRSCRPVIYYDYYTYWSPYRPYYSRCHSHRVVYAQAIYRPHRTSSGIVHSRHHAQVTRYRASHSREENTRHHSGQRDQGTKRYSHERESGRDNAVRERSSRSSGSYSRERQDTYKPAERTRSTEVRERNTTRRTPEVTQRTYEPKRERTVEKREPANANRSYQPRETKSLKTEKRSAPSESKRTSSRSRKSD